MIGYKAFDKNLIGKTYKGTVYTTYRYDEKIADCYIVDGIMATQLIVVRRWEDLCWYAPTKEYLKR